MMTLQGLADSVNRYLDDHPELADVEVKVWIRTGKTHRSLLRKLDVFSVGCSGSPPKGMDEFHIMARQERDKCPPPR